MAVAWGTNIYSPLVYSEAEKNNWTLDRFIREKVLCLLITCSPFLLTKLTISYEMPVHLKVNSEAENIEKGQEKFREFLFIGKQSPSLSTTFSIKMEPRLDSSFPTMGMPTRKIHMQKSPSKAISVLPPRTPSLFQLLPKTVYLGEAGLGFPPSGVEESNSGWFRPWEGASERQILMWEILQQCSYRPQGFHSLKFASPCLG